MSVQDFTQFSHHDIARAEIEAWRGECLDLFAQGEAMIGALLELGLAKKFKVQLSQYASQRTLEAMQLIDMIGGSEAEVKDATDALFVWQGVESRGELLAHGTSRTTLDRDGHWYAVIDMVTYRAGKPNRGRWVVNQAESEDFLKQLGKAFTKLKLQLGCTRLRLDD
jgi:hypothetical protein